MKLWTQNFKCNLKFLIMISRESFIDSKLRKWWTLATEATSNLIDTTDTTSVQTLQIYHWVNDGPKEIRGILKLDPKLTKKSDNQFQGDQIMSSDVKKKATLYDRYWIGITANRKELNTSIPLVCINIPVGCFNSRII